METNYKTYISNMHNHYTYRTTVMDADYALTRFARGEINLTLSCQRDYVWPEEYQQEFWDTLLCGDRIPEMHAIVEDRIISVFDGKQRLTTLFRMLGNEKQGIKKEERIPLYLNGSMCRLRDREYFIQNFVKKEKQSENKIYFEDLTPSCQNFVLNTTLTFAEYSNVSNDDLTLLFRKLNTADGLSDFLIAISRNLNIRLDYTAHLIEHDIFKYMQEGRSLRDRSEKTEIMLVRLLCLENFGICNLTPQALIGMMPKINNSKTPDIIKKYKRIFDTFDRETIIFLVKKWAAHETYLPIVFYLLGNYNLSNYQVRRIFKTNEVASLKTTQHSLLNKDEINKRIEVLTEIIERKLQELRDEESQVA